MAGQTSKAGAVLSKVQVNCVAAVLGLSHASVNDAPETSIDVAPSLLGVNTAVYTVELVGVKLDSAPFETFISPRTKSVVASLAVKVKAIDESFETAPLETVELEIVIVGTVKSTLKLDDETCVAAFP